MKKTDELIELRAERIQLLRELTNTTNAKRQQLNKRLVTVSRRIQKLTGIQVAPARDRETEF